MIFLKEYFWWCSFVQDGVSAELQVYSMWNSFRLFILIIVKTMIVLLTLSSPFLFEFRQPRPDLTTLQTGKKLKHFRVLVFFILSLRKRLISDRKATKVSSNFSFQKLLMTSKLLRPVLSKHWQNFFSCKDTFFWHRMPTTSTFKSCLAFNCGEVTIRHQVVLTINLEPPLVSHLGCETQFHLCFTWRVNRTGQSKFYSVTICFLSVRYQLALDVIW